MITGPRSRWSFGRWSWPASTKLPTSSRTAEPSSAPSPRAFSDRSDLARSDSTSSTTRIGKWPKRPSRSEAMPASRPRATSLTQRVGPCCCSSPWNRPASTSRSGSTTPEGRPSRPIPRPSTTGTATPTRARRSTPRFPSCRRRPAERFTRRFKRGQSRSARNCGWPSTW